MKKLKHFARVPFSLVNEIKKKKSVFGQKFESLLDLTFNKKKTSFKPKDCFTQKPASP